MDTDECHTVKILSLSPKYVCLVYINVMWQIGHYTIVCVLWMVRFVNMNGQVAWYTCFLDYINVLVQLNLEDYVLFILMVGHYTTTQF